MESGDEIQMIERKWKMKNASPKIFGARGEPAKKVEDIKKNRQREAGGTEAEHMNIQRRRRHAADVSIDTDASSE